MRVEWLNRLNLKCSTALRTHWKRNMLRSSMHFDQAAQMEVVYSFTREDYLHFIRFWFRRNRGRHIRQIVRLFILLIVGYIAVFLMWNLALGLVLELSTELAIICTGVVYGAQRLRMRRIQENVLGDRTTRIGPEGIFGRFPQFEILNHWKGIREVAEDEGYVFFYTDETRAHVVPKRAFASLNDLDQFREAANSYWKSNRG